MPSFLFRVFLLPKVASSRDSGFSSSGRLCSRQLKASAEWKRYRQASSILLPLLLLLLLLLLSLFFFQTLESQSGTVLPGGPILADPGRSTDPTLESGTVVLGSDRIEPNPIGSADPILHSLVLTLLVISTFLN